MPHKKPKPQTCLKGGKISERAPKEPANLNNSSVYLRVQLSLEYKLSTNHFDSYIQWFEFIEDLAMVKPRKKGYNL